MSEIWRKLGISSEKHIIEEDLLRFADGELRPWHTRRVQRHLERCWSCRGRYEQMQSAVRDFVDYRKRTVAPYLPLSNSARDRFLRRIEELRVETAQPWPVRAAQFLRSAMMPSSHPVFATLVIAIVAALTVFIVWQTNVPTVSATDLLDRAQAWDSSPAGARQQGVIREKVEIRTPTARLERSVYRDVTRKQRPRNADASSQPIGLQTAFKEGHIDWQWPLSASDFRKWNDQLPEKQQEVFSDRRGTLTLRTRTNSSEVQEQSITVRNADFHPVSRRLVVRDLGEIDISEMNYDVLAWSEVDIAQLFEPDINIANSAPLLPTLRKSLVAVGPSLAALDEAELRARLALNQVGADTAENISVKQTGKVVSITGFVETGPRKREIEHALAGIPLVSASISTFELRQQRLGPSDQTQVSHITEQSLAAQSSPLETFLASHSLPQEQAVQLSRGLFDEALEIDRQALAIDSLEKRFPSPYQNNLTAENKALFQELFQRHRSALNAALAKEQDLVKPFEGRLPSDPPGNSSVSDPNAPADLLRFAGENRRLSGELLAHGGTDAQRSGEVIMKELADSLRRCEQIAQSLER